MKKVRTGWTFCLKIEIFQNLDTFKISINWLLTVEESMFLNERSNFYSGKKLNTEGDMFLKVPKFTQVKNDPSNLKMNKAEKIENFQNFPNSTEQIKLNSLAKIYPGKNSPNSILRIGKPAKFIFQPKNK